MRRALLFFLSLLAFPVLGEAQAVFVQGKGFHQASLSSVSITFDTPLTAGTGNWVICGHNSASQTNTWTISNAGSALTWAGHPSNPFNHSAGATSGRIYVWAAPISASGVTTITATRNTGTASTQLFCAEIHGLHASIIIDQTNRQEVNGATQFTTPVSVTTTQHNEIIFLMVGSTTGASYTGDAPGFTDVDPALANGTQAAQAQYRIVSSIGTYDTGTPPTGFTAAASEIMQGVMVSLFAANPGTGGGGGSGGACRTMLLSVGGCE